MRKYVIDTHVHTVSSGHAYSTLSDYVAEAKIKGLEMFVLTDHGPEMPGATHWYHIANQRVIPDVIDGIQVLKGVEVNIMDYNGRLDIQDELLSKLDLVIASLHLPCINPGTKEENTSALINTMKNQNVDIIGHSGNPDYEINIEEFVKAAKKYNCAIELNNSSDKLTRFGSNKNCVEIAKLAKKYGVYITTGSDAHYKSYLGDFEEVEKILDKVGISEELILTTSTEKLKKYLKSKGNVK
ncbi:MAG: phosphatase [Bacillota bacterium]|nr:phosphatase [Bacillota bacterium]